MPVFGRRSKTKLAECHQDLQDIMNEVIKEYDISVICGHRSKEEQNEAFKKGNSKLQYPRSKHNTYPSNAVDVVPYPIDWNDIDRFRHMVKIIKRVAEEKGIEIVCGGDWKNFKDWPHIELKPKARKKEYLPSEITEDEINKKLSELE